VGKAARALAVGCQPLLVPDYAPISSHTKCLTNCWSQLLAVVKSRFDFMKQFPMLATFAPCQRWLSPISLDLSIRVSRFPTHITFYLVTAFDGVPTATSLVLGEMLGSSDCVGLNGAERWPLEAVLIHKTPAGLSPRLIPGSPQSLNLFSNMPYKLSLRHNRF
jgi:hypothetical protein